MPFGTQSLSSNQTGLAITEESSYKTLPGSPVWTDLQPNSYSDFGGEIKRTVRAPIKADRQRQKGVVTDVDAAGAFEIDFTQKTPYTLLPGFLFANWRTKLNNTVSAVTSTGYTVASGGTSYAQNELIFAEGFNTAANNGLKAVGASSTGTEVKASGLTAEASPPAGSKITKVGVQGASGDLTLTVSGGVATLGSTTLNFTTLGGSTLIPGEWIWLGGDQTAEKFATAACNGWYRIKTVAANSIVFDRKPDNAVTDNGSSKTIRLFYGHVLKNESSVANIVNKSYQIERQLATNNYEYIRGCGANQLELNLATADKVTASLSYVAGDRTTATSAASGTHTGVVAEDGFNTTSNVTRLRMLDADNSDADLFTFVTDMKLMVNNNIKGVKAIGELGAFDLTAGEFAVSGSVTAYFTSVSALTALDTNHAVSLDFTMVTKNQGYLVDLPYLSLGNAKPNVTKDEAVTLPIDMDAAEHPVLHHTMLVGFYAYLPTLAMT